MPSDAVDPDLPTPDPTTEEHLGWLADAVDRFAGLLAGADPGTPVPSCPGWDLAALAAHLGGVHAWARGAIVDGHPDTAFPAPPDDPAALPGWYRGQAEALLATLRGADPDAAAWGFGPPPRTVRFWFRRQQHETSMHLWDVLGALGEPAGYGGPGAADGVRRALDGVDEVVTMFFPRQVRLGRTPPLEHSLALVATEGGRWLLAGGGTPGEEPEEGPRATVTGPAEDLLRLLWRRFDLTTGLATPRLALTGDERAARSVLEAGLTP